MSAFMETLNDRTKKLIETKLFETVMDLVIYANPIALAPQLYTVITADSVEGISIIMWLIFAVIQLAFVFHGIKTKSVSVFLSMLISMAESITIVVLVLSRG